MIPEPLRLIETAPADGLFAAWCAVWAASQLAERPDDPPRPARDHVALADQVLAPGGSRDGTHRAALLGKTVVGALRLLFPLRDNPTVAILDVAVHPDHRRRGVGGVLLAEGIRLAGEQGRTELISEVDEPAEGVPGRAFALRHGWTCDLLEARRDLVLPPDGAALSALEAAALAASAGYDVVTWRDRTPDDLLDDRALLERRMTTDAPHGARLKAAVLRELLVAVPEVRRISTYNSDANHPMVAVNEALGFRRAGYLATWGCRL